MLFRNLLLILMLLISARAYSQQDIDFNLNAHLLPGKKILKVKRDFYDPYLWVLAQNNEVYRVNSLTQAVVNYTAAFSAINLQFIDIAGRSKDTVFIATKSTNVIQYTSGAINMVNVAGIVNSIGINYASVNPLTGEASILRIGTNSSGMYLYNMDTGQPPAVFDIGSTKVYEATYRREMFADSNVFTKGSLADTINYLPVYLNWFGTLYSSFLWEGGTQFGYNINTAYFVPVIIYNFAGQDNPIYINVFWGNSKGMFQLNDAFDNNPVFPYGHYLDGINVNKITSIYGLTAFGSGHQYGSPGLIKDNLLIGTDQGFYFSSSTYGKSSVNGLRSFSLFHYNVLGNTVINDICVNVESAKEPICEDGVWLAADDGLYLINPVYSTFLNTQHLQAIRFKNQPDTLSKINVCLGDSTQALIDANNFTGNSFEWYKNGQKLSSISNDTLTIKTAGDYYAVLYDPCQNIHIESNHLKVGILSNPVLSFNYPDTMQLCINTPDTLKTDNVPGYHYQWYTNDVLNGDTTSAFTVIQSGKYKVEVSTCSGLWVSSKDVQVNFVQLPVPVINTDKPAYCVGDNATLSISLPQGISYTINWYKDNVLLANNINQTSLTTNVTGNYTVSVVNNTQNIDGTTCSQTSAVVPLLFNHVPTVGIKKLAKTTLCNGQTIDLLASYTGGTIKWSTGETTDQISVNTGGKYDVTITSASGCIADTSINITLLPSPVLNVSDTSICTYRHQPVIIKAPSGFAQYNWNGVNGGQTYRVIEPQTVSLIVTDANGCQDSQQIKVFSKCSEIEIPNTFTPNNDGINDTWVIQGLDNNQAVLVRVFTRYGTQIFESYGYGVPWNGEYKGKKLPTGTYYYIITTKNSSQHYSGPITIIY
jgi:gliding motility-associated-like protein